MTWFSLTDTCSSTSSIQCQPSVLAFMTLITQYLTQSFDSRYTDSKWNGNNITNEAFDFIIVGAGSAGSVVANRLSEEKNWNILLLEAGDEEPLIVDIPALRSVVSYSKLNNVYNTEPENTACGRRSSALLGGRVMGGTSTINGRRYIRGTKKNYDDWAKAVSDREWDWDHVLPYFKKSEDMRDREVLRKNPYFHGTGGYLTVENAPYEDENVEAFLNGWKELGYDEVDYNAGSQLGTAKTQFTSVHGSRQSANGAFLRPIRGKRSNLVIRPNSQATKIIIDPASKQTRGVEFIDLKSNKTIRVFARKEVILSCGAFGSPKLLMLSGVGPADHLKDLNIKVIIDLPVGKTLNNHINVSPLHYTVRKGKSTPLTVEDLQNDLVYWLNTHEGPMSNNNMGRTVTYLQTKYAKHVNEADIEIYFIKTVSQKPTRTSRTPYSYFDGLSTIVLLLDTTGTSNLILNKSDPIWGNPIISTDFMNSHNIKVLVEGSKIARKLSDTKSFNRTGLVLNRYKNENCKNFDFDSDEYLKCIIECKVTVSDHPVSTCKMGSKNDPLAVVDSRLKVYGIKGLRVIDNSIIPVLPRASLNAPAMMIGEKGSDIIKEDWKKLVSPNFKFINKNRFKYQIYLNCLNVMFL